MSLADELLADMNDGNLEEESMMVDEVEDLADVQDVAMNFDKDQSVRTIAKLRDSALLQNLLKDIDYYTTNNQRTEMCGPPENDPEYRLIVEANSTFVEIENEINLVHKFTRDVYNKRFPELESLVQQPSDYIKTVKELRNDINTNSKNWSKSLENLQKILPPHTVMVVSMSASTTQGQDLTEEEMNRVMEACDMALDLVVAKQKIHEYVESRMSFVAPNLSIVLGASTAAKLMGAAGGLKNLSKIPSCNVMLIGAQKKTLSGFSTKVIIPHAGYVYYSDLVQRNPPELRKKAARLLAGKVALAARVDSCNESSDGSTGESFLNDIIQKLEKLQEPPPVKQIKPLPAPIDVSRKKRGGRRYRKMKERLGMTEMRKVANRMAFGEIEEDAYQEDLGLTLGTLKGKSGHIRGPVVDSKTKARISRTLQQTSQKHQMYGGSSTVKRQISGTVSTVAFTPHAGLEIINPSVPEPKKSESDKTYFSDSASFKNVYKDKK